MKKLVTDILVPVVIFFITVLSRFSGVRKFRGKLARKNTWYKIHDSGAVCADGSVLPFYAKRGGSGEKLIVFFNGGGASWSEETAARPIDVYHYTPASESYYFPRVYALTDLFFGGILDTKNKENPFRDWNFFYIPYATADFHIGDADFPYTKNGGQKILHHRGLRNIRAGMEICKKLFPEAKRLFVMGDSAGGFGCVAHAPFIAETWPGAESITVYSDGAQLFSPAWTRILDGVWNVPPEMHTVDAPGGLPLEDAENDLYYRLVSRAGARLGGRAVFLRSNTVADDTLTVFQNKLNHGAFTRDAAALAEFQEGLCRSEKLLAAGEIPYYRFIGAHGRDRKTGFTRHTLVRYGQFFHGKNGAGSSLRDWLRDAVEGRCRNEDPEDFLRKGV